MPRERQSPTEIEITPAMIEAGLGHLYRYHPDRGVDAEDTVGLIFQLMLSCYRRDPSEL